MTSKVKTLPRGAVRRRGQSVAPIEVAYPPEAQTQERTADPVDRGADEPAAEPASPSAPYKFAIYWFGIPLAVVIASVFLRMSCGGVS